MSLIASEPATQYRTGSGPGSPAGQPGWGGGSDRILPLTKVITILLQLSPASGRYRSRFCIEWRLV